MVARGGAQRIPRPPGHPAGRSGAVGRTRPGRPPVRRSPTSAAALASTRPSRPAVLIDVPGAAGRGGARPVFEEDGEAASSSPSGPRRCRRTRARSRSRAASASPSRRRPAPPRRCARRRRRSASTPDAVEIVAELDTHRHRRVARSRSRRSSGCSPRRPSCAPTPARSCGVFDGAALGAARPATSTARSAGTLFGAHRADALLRAGRRDGLGRDGADPHRLPHAPHDGSADR